MELIKDMGIFDDFFTKEQCEEWITYFKMKEKQGSVYTRQEQHEQTPKLEKHDNACQISVDDLGVAIVDDFADIFWKSWWEYAEEFSVLKRIDWDIRNWKIQETNPSGGYHLWHYENGKGAVDGFHSREAVWCVYLNDNFDAGETEFLYQQYRIKPKTGRLAIFPAGYTHTHRGNPPIGGTKYILTGWVSPK